MQGHAPHSGELTAVFQSLPLKAAQQRVLGPPPKQRWGGGGGGGGGLGIIHLIVVVSFIIYHVLGT